VPDGPREVDLDIWDANYSEDKLFQSHSIRHTCEGSYFRNLLNEIQVTGDWSVGSFEDYFADYTAKLDAADSKAIVDRIRASKSPKHAARFHAIQLSSEFLIEASGMTRNLQGYFGPEQSEYFKILNDEYGYGVHSAKHSTLYMDFLASLQLQKTAASLLVVLSPGNALLLELYKRILQQSHEFLPGAGRFDAKRELVCRLSKIL